MLLKEFSQKWSCPSSICFRMLARMSILQLKPYHVMLLLKLISGWLPIRMNEMNE